jgi:hypothetical protein
MELLGAFRVAALETVIIMCSLNPEVGAQENCN